MLKQISSQCHLKDVDGVLVKKKILDLNNQIELIREETNNKVRDIVEQTKEDAQQLGQQGYMEGYQNGILAALSFTAFYFGNCNDYYSSKRDELIVEIRQILSKAVEEPGVLLSVTDEWIQSVSVSDNILYIYLPEVKADIEPQLKKMLVNMWPGKVSISYHSSNKYVMTCGQQIAEFAPKVFVEQSIDALMDKFNIIPNEMQNISEEAIDLLIEYCRTIRNKLTSNR
ncbi:hypothetical protein [Yersinia enterocolitica]|uniref:hypothetical protein n=1 Tax=Yersinia enterocolitica TaxID=630 RepID=UPI00398CD4D1